MKPSEDHSTSTIHLGVRRVTDVGYLHGKQADRGDDATGLWSHEIRFHDANTVNAQTSRQHLNHISCQETGFELVAWNKADPKMAPVFSQHYLADLCRRLIDQYDIKTVPLNSVFYVCLELEVSPAWFRDGDMARPLNPDKIKLWRSVTHTFLRQKFDVTSMGVFAVGITHEDETTPHFDAFIFPVSQKALKIRGRLAAGAERGVQRQFILCASRLFTGDKINPKTQKTKTIGTISKLRDEYAEFLHVNGIDVHRGLHNPQVSHQRLRSHEKPSLKDLPKLPDVILPPIEKGSLGLAESAEVYRQRAQLEVDNKLGDIYEVLQALNQTAADAVNAKKRCDEYYATALAKDRENEEIKKILEKQKAELEQTLAQVASLKKEVGNKKYPLPSTYRFLAEVLKLFPQREHDNYIFDLPESVRVTVFPDQNTWQYLNPRLSAPLKGSSLFGLLEALGCLTERKFCDWLLKYFTPDMLAAALQSHFSAIAQRSGVRAQGAGHILSLDQVVPQNIPALISHLVKAYGLIHRDLNSLVNNEELSTNTFGHVLFRANKDHAWIVQNTKKEGSIILWRETPPAFLRDPQGGGYACDIIVAYSPVDMLVLDRYKSIFSLSGASIVLVRPASLALQPFEGNPAIWMFGQPPQQDLNALKANNRTLYPLSLGNFPSIKQLIADYMQPTRRSIAEPVVKNLKVQISTIQNQIAKNPPNY